ncbi:alpha/beta hydrolase [Maritimibacter fusiformis]|uniref:Alpha/beta hydrolase n=1 Tax=Maritimibacter fusiformis TaxID=2603819 RepID=A0A5D0RPW6_9RHOB|nr:alpha/beta hydrolase [Maritimibacter fusiformis]TYB82935.1 alpha/beta hydrolase [Maritimibacter fusiformis]
MEPAPLHDDIARGPRGGRAWWLNTPDGVRIRAAIWQPEGTPTGTVMLFPGRSEYIEKYGPAAADLTARGFAVVTVDWRGQGLADRATPDPLLGHVGHFDEYQRDIDAVNALIRAEALPGPFFLIGHSMGGCIGLRALHNGLPIRAAAFSAPMWGLQLPTHKRPLAWVSSFGGTLIGLGERLVPTGERECYAAIAPYDDNMLTTDPEMFAFLQGQLRARPALALGGPTLSWLRAALLETTRLTRMAPPPTPAVTFLGSRERIVAPDRVHRIMGGWTGGALELVEGAEHEIVMERPETRTRFFDRAAALFGAHS